MPDRTCSAGTTTQFFTHYSTEDGLSQNTVMSMLQDHKDNLWFATWDGINRFDGYNFKTYKARQGNYISLTNNRADRMYEDRYGFLWLLTYDNRVHRFDPKTETFEQVPAAGEEGSTYNIHAIQVLPDGTVWLLTEHDGAIRVVTLPQKNYTTKSDIYSTKSGLFPADHFYQVYQDKAGNHWLLTDNGLGMIRPGEQQPVNFFVETKGKQDGMNQAFYAVRECEDDICFASRQRENLVLSETGRRVSPARTSDESPHYFYTHREQWQYCSDNRFGRVLSLQPEDKQTYALFSRDL